MTPELLMASDFPKFDLSLSVTLRPLSLDDLASLRYVHDTTFRSLAADYYSCEEIAAFCGMLKRAEYAGEMLSNNVHAAWIGDEMIGTAGWRPGSVQDFAARIHSVFVQPLFAGSGVGRLLLQDAESRALSAGYRVFSVRASSCAIQFYGSRGYRITSHGVFATPAGIELPVTYMRKSARIW